MRTNSISNPYLQHREGSDVDDVLTLSAACTRFGRSATLVEVPLRDESLSRQHCAIVHSSDRESFLIDLGSASGSYVDGERLAPHKPRKLADGSVLSFGSGPATYTFRVVPPSNAAGAGARGGKRKR